MKLTQEQLEAIRQRAENATPSPWQIATTTDGAYVLDTDDMVIAATIERTEDAAFIAHARTDIPALLDHIAELEAEIEELRKAGELLLSQVNHACGHVIPAGSFYGGRMAMIKALNLTEKEDDR